jgi:hypothetical protein
MIMYSCIERITENLMVRLQGWRQMRRQIVEQIMAEKSVEI